MIQLVNRVVLSSTASLPSRLHSNDYCSDLYILPRWRPDLRIAHVTAGSLSLTADRGMSLSFSAADSTAALPPLDFPKQHLWYFDVCHHQRKYSNLSQVCVGCNHFFCCRPKEKCSLIYLTLKCCWRVVCQNNRSLLPPFLQLEII